MGVKEVIKMIKKIFKRDIEDDTFKMVLKSRCVKDGMYEVNGVIFYADTHTEALKKYRRAKEEF